VVARASASDIVEQVANELDHELLISHPVVEDPTDSKGLPFAAADGQSARFLPFGDLERALQARKRPLIWFLDDLGQAALGAGREDATAARVASASTSCPITSRSSRPPTGARTTRA
jgi:hypothetical protein